MKINNEQYLLNILGQYVEQIANLSYFPQLFKEIQ
jgi:hypothetical protein